MISVHEKQVFVCMQCMCVCVCVCVYVQVCVRVSGKWNVCLSLKICYRKHLTTQTVLKSQNVQQLEHGDTFFHADGALLSDRSMGSRLCWCWHSHSDTV